MTKKDNLKQALNEQFEKIQLLNKIRWWKARKVWGGLIFVCNKRRIYWKNLIWNYTWRYVRILKYYWRWEHKTKWKNYYYPHKRFVTPRQEMIYCDQMLKYLEELNNETNKSTKSSY